jgi:hypothetical protein
MAQNPLQQYFRQPKIYIALPSNGVYNAAGAVDGDLTNMPIFGMTGMDEIILKTPDALITGESAVKVIESCCPNIKDAWSISSIDSNMLYAAIKIATYGNTISVTQTCPGCSTDNDYDLDLNVVVEHYAHCKYNNKLVIGDLIIKTQPLTYRQHTDLNIRTFKLQQRLAQIQRVDSEEEQNVMFKELFEELRKAQNELYMISIESVEVNNTVVIEKEFIAEWLTNSDKSIFDSIKEHIDSNKNAWALPTYPVKCTNCSIESNVYVDLDQTNFFDNA